MSEADKMFEELGYEKKDFTEFIKYTKDSEIIYYENRNIIFYLKGYKVGACYDDEEDFFPKINLTMQELKAINKKCEELEWL